MKWLYDQNLSNPPPMESSIFLNDCKIKINRMEKIIKDIKQLENEIEKFDKDSLCYREIKQELHYLHEERRELENFQST